MSKLPLPSGLVGDVRKIKGVEIANIAESADGGGPADGGFSSLLSGCWVETLDAGPYSFVAPGTTKPDWSRILKGDLLVGIVHLRQISLTDGDEFDFDAHCEECRKKIPWTVKLSELPMKTLPEASAEKVKAGVSFETIVAGRTLKYQLQTLAQEEPVLKLMKQMSRKRATIVDILLGQTTFVEGVKPDLRARWSFLSQLSMGELFDLQSEMAANDCGLDTSINVQCQNRDCLWEQAVHLPLLNRRFFSPKKRPTTIVTPVLASGEEDFMLPSGGATSSEESPSTGGASDAPISGGSSTAAVGTPR